MEFGKLNKRWLSIVFEDEKYPSRFRKFGRTWIIRFWKIRVVFTTRPANRKETSRALLFAFKEVSNQGQGR